MSTPKAPAPDSRETMLKLDWEYRFKGFVIITSCIIVLLATVGYLIQGFFDKKAIDIKDVVILAGIGFSAASGSYFRPLRGK